MKKVIPAQETIVCDVCEKERSFFLMGAKVAVSATRRYGPRGELMVADKRLDLCDECSKKLDEFLKLEW